MTFRRTLAAGAILLALLPLSPPTLAATTAAGIAFEPRIDIGVDTPRSVAIGDFTGDGLADVAYSFSCGCAVNLITQQPDGSLASPASLTPTSTFGQQLGLAAGDLNGDGLTDLALAVNTGVDIFKQASGSLSAPTHVTLDNLQAEQVAIAELTGDTLNDMVITTNNGLYLAVKNSGPGWTTSSLGFGPIAYYELELGDVTGDGHADIVYGSSTLLSVYPNDGTGAFGPEATYPLSTGGFTSAALGDFNTDGLTDVAVMINGNSTAKLNLLTQSDTGTLNPRIVSSTYDIPQAAATADMNGDGLDDLVVMHGIWKAIGIYVQGVGGFDKEALFPIPVADMYPKSVALGDLNTDGKVDVAWTDSGGGLSIEKQRAQLELRVPSKIKQGGDAAWSMHLGPYATTSNQIVKIYESSGGRPFQLVTQHAVNAHGNLTGTLQNLTRTTTLKAVWDGDARAAAVETTRRIGVPALVTGKLSGFRTTDGKYKVYDAGDKPLYTATVSPNNGGGYITFKLEKFAAGDWHFVDKLQTKLNARSKAAVRLSITNGVRFRINADFYGTKQNLGATSAWSYLIAR